jgi:hypothetical protein
LNDSDDARELALVKEPLPKEREKDHPCNYFKKLDLYGIEPGLMIEGKPKFRSWWGVFFSMFTILSVIYFAYSKMLFMYFNRSSHFIMRNVYFDYNCTQGQ